MLEVVEHLLRRLVALLRILPDRLVDHRAQGGRDGSIAFVQGCRGIVDGLAHDGQRVIPHEGHLAGQEFVEHDAERVDVGPLVPSLALYLLGRHVVGGAQAVVEITPRHAPRPLHQGDAEIEELELPLGGDQDVLRLEVTVGDAVSVGVSQRAGELPAIPDRLIDAEWQPAAEVLTEGLTLHVLQHQVWTAAVVAHVEGALHIGMIEAARDGRLPAKALEGLRVPDDGE